MTENQQMNPLTTELQLDEQQRQDDRLRKAGEMEMGKYARRLEDRKFERKLARVWLFVFIRQVNQ